MCVKTEIKEDFLTFYFNPEYQKACKYDEWEFYISHLQSIEKKGVDIVCIDELENCTYLIEIKDFRKRPKQRGDEEKKIEEKQWDKEIAKKIIDSLAGLYWISICNFENENLEDMDLLAELKAESKFAKEALSKPIKIIFHCEPPEKSIDFCLDIFDKLITKVKGINKKIIVGITVGNDINAYRWKVEKRPIPEDN